MIKRKKTRAVRVGRVIIGGGFPISIQTMWKEPIGDIDSNLIEKINALQAIGCDILRISVPDIRTAERVGRLTENIDIPLVADIHFDYRIALRILDFNIAKLRINPGNIRDKTKIEKIIRKASARGVPVRVGINSGSLPGDLKDERDTALAMVKAAERELEIFSKIGFESIVFSLKSSDIHTTVRANKLFSERYDYPLHIGLTEAGPLIQGTVKSTIALNKLIEEGIGDTIRVSLSSSPEDEIIAAKEIVSSSTGIKRGINIISCPLCGRASFDVHSFLNKIGPSLNSMDKNITVAIMGCVVNGPGEAKSADIGITGAGNYAVIFKRGKMIHKVSSERAAELFKEELLKFQ